MRMRIEARSCNQGSRENDIFYNSATLPTYYLFYLFHVEDVVLTFQEIINFPT